MQDVAKKAGVPAFDFVKSEAAGPGCCMPAQAAASRHAPARPRRCSPRTPTRPPLFCCFAVDIEGAEGMVFMPGADTRWIQKARLVSLEVHDYFHG